MGIYDQLEQLNRVSSASKASQGRSKTPATKPTLPHTPKLPSIRKEELPAGELPNKEIVSTKRQQVSKQASKSASENASTLARSPDKLIDCIRKSVKLVGKETAFVRLTPEEKKRLTELVFSYRQRGIKTSENEINRIAINFMLEDCQANGPDSILARVIKALLA